MVQKCQQEAGEEVLLTYLPRSFRAKRKNGTDQALMLARAISKETGIPVMPLLSRVRFGGAVQKKLSRRERIDNAKLLFTLSPKADLKGKTVILIDDLVTTGSSMAAGVRLLRQAGVTRCFGICIAVDS